MSDFIINVVPDQNVNISIGGIENTLINALPQDSSTNITIGGIENTVIGPKEFIVDIKDVVYTTGDQGITGFKDFYDRPTVNGVGVLLIGEGGGGGSSSPDDSNLIIGLSMFL